MNKNAVVFRKKLEELLKLKNTEKVIEFNQELDDFFFESLEDEHKAIHHDSEFSYTDIEINALSTPYTDYYRILNDLNPGEPLVDIGSGYGRGTFLSNLLNLNECISIELSEKRVYFAQTQMNRLNYNRGGHQCLDISCEPIPFASSYYLYFPRCFALYKFLLFLRMSVVGAKVYVSESHGDIIQFLSYLSFLRLDSKIECTLPRHNKYIHKYEVVRSEEEGELDWFIESMGEEFVLLVNDFHLLLKKEVSYLIYSRHLDLEFNESEYLFALKTKRRLFKAKLGHKVQPMSDFSDSVQKEIEAGEKIFLCDDEFIVEKNNKLTLCK